MADNALEHANDVYLGRGRGRMVMECRVNGM